MANNPCEEELRKCISELEQILSNANVTRDGRLETASGMVAEEPYEERDLNQQDFRQWRIDCLTVVRRCLPANDPVCAEFLGDVQNSDGTDDDASRHLADLKGLLTSFLAGRFNQGKGPPEKHIGF